MGIWLMERKGVRNQVWMDTHGDAAHGKSKWSEVGNGWCGAE